MESNAKRNKAKMNNKLGNTTVGKEMKMNRVKKIIKFQSLILFSKPLHGRLYLKRGQKCLYEHVNS